MDRSALVIVALLMAASTHAGAGHGIDWTLVGESCLDEVHCFDAEVQWSSGGGGVVRVRLTDPDTGVALPMHQFAAHQYFENVNAFGPDPQCPPGTVYSETWDYRVYDLLTGGVTFDVGGSILLCAGPHVWIGELHGHYLAFDMTLRHPLAPEGT